jgi:soluble P-type ATPase
VTLLVAVPGRAELRLAHLILDVNGTLTDRGALLAGVPERIDRLRECLDVRLLTADTYGTLPAIVTALGGIPAERVGSGVEKAAVADRLGARSCAAIGNGANDEALLRAVGLGIAVLGREGASARSLAAADIVCGSVLDALDLLLAPEALAATLRD